jgi:6-pyruvoyl-tetrahydropterin synthase
MDIDFSTMARFSGSHAPKGVKCASGHTWKVRVGVSGPLEKTDAGVRRVRHSENLRDDLLKVVREIDGRHLEDMMPGVLTTNEGIAAWLLERLPNANRVEVSHLTETAMVHRKVR